MGLRPRGEAFLLLLLLYLENIKFLRDPPGEWALISWELEQQNMTTWAISRTCGQLVMNGADALALV